ncbi:MAG: hypothetical protein ACYDG2_12025 [Ruminiclostridium sp.]
MSISYGMTDKDINNQLLECSIIVVSLLLKQYKAKVIDITDFRIHTSKKISYIVNNFNSIKDNIEKRTTENLINECNKITNAN